jgi:hypothetical protein
MPPLRGATLLVNLSAAQTRRRLHGFGHGVRQVHSGGRNRAVIIHTATGGHLRALQARFADVGWADQEEDLPEPLENLRNLGPQSATWLRAAGICHRADLERIGPVVAFRRVREAQPRASLNLLWALAAALDGRDWRELTAPEKAALRAELARN